MRNEGPRGAEHHASEGYVTLSADSDRESGAE